MDSRLRRTRLQESKVALQQLVRQLLPADERDALEDIRVNAEWLGQRLRDLHRAEGGMRLQ